MEAKFRWDRCAPCAPALLPFLPPSNHGAARALTSSDQVTKGPGGFLAGLWFCNLRGSNQPHVQAETFTIPPTTPCPQLTPTHPSPKQWDPHASFLLPRPSLHRFLSTLPQHPPPGPPSQPLTSSRGAVGLCVIRPTGHGK